MFNKRNAERELLYAEINRLKKINRKLEDENRRLRSSIDDTEKYQEKYKKIVKSLEMMKKSYEKQKVTFDGLSVSYKKQLEDLEKRYKK